MKTIRNICGFLSLILLTSTLTTNAQEQKAKEMLKDPVKQKEIFDAISSDSIQMKQFMRYVMRNKKTMQTGNRQAMMTMMKGDTAMAKMMMDNMISMMEKDSSMCKMMGRDMMNNEHMKGMMQSMRQQKGNRMKGGMMCPMHDKMNMGKMEKEKTEHHHEK